MTPLRSNPLFVSLFQVINKKGKTWCKKKKQYFKLKSNKVDCLIIIIAIIGIGMRFIEATWEAARMLYCINFVIFCCRLFRMYFVSHYLGPRVHMIQKVVSLIHIKVLQMLKIDTQWVHVSTAVNKAGWMLVDDGSRIRQPDFYSWLLQLFH